MKIIYVGILSLIGFSVHAQWTTSGTNIYNSNTGNVGIGITTAPDSKLEVTGKISTGLRLNGTSSDYEGLAIYNTTSANLASGNAAVIQFYNNSNNSNGLKGASIRSISGFFGWESDLSFRVTKNNSYTTQTILDAMVLKGGSGYMGVGTTTPEARLHVQNNAVLPGTVGTSFLLTKVSNTCSTCNTNTFQSNLWLMRDNSGNSGWQSVRLHDGISIDNSYLTPGTDTKTWWERSPYQDVQSLGTASNTYMTIKAGSVGIGTTTPDATLAVKGQVHAQEVKVDLNGAIAPDYVFEKDYFLPSLESVKTYIDKNKHLPEVPSAKEMEANGINLSEMNMLLLKKVEELTLYVIELKKRDEAQQKEINKLKSQR
jgi:hypothetical protein